MKTVTFVELGGECRKFTSRHRTDDESTAITRAIKKRWGARVFFQVDRGVGNGEYGQMFRPSDDGTNNYSVTKRIRIDVE